MSQIFVDTSALVALKNKSESRHLQATNGFKTLLEKNFRIVTSNFVFAEVYTLLRYRVNHHVAVEIGNLIRQNKLIQYLRITEEIESSAWEIAVSYKDKDFSFTDCASFALMEKLGINDAFTFDDHFKQFGFTIFP